MPDANGWHSTAFVGSDGRPVRWHYCAGHDHDELVLDTPAARREHERECRRAARSAAARAERQRRRDAANRLRNLNRLRAETRDLERAVQP